MLCCRSLKIQKLTRFSYKTSLAKRESAIPSFPFPKTESELKCTQEAAILYPAAVRGLRKEYVCVVGH